MTRPLVTCSHTCPQRSKSKSNLREHLRFDLKWSPNPQVSLRNRKIMLTQRLQQLLLHSLMGSPTWSLRGNRDGNLVLRQVSRFHLRSRGLYLRVSRQEIPPRWSRSLKTLQNSPLAFPNSKRSQNLTFCSSQWT